MEIEAKTGDRQVLGAVAKAGTDIEGLIRNSLDAVGGHRDTALTAFTDSCPGLRGILAGTGVLEPPILDWSYIAMRRQRLKQVADGLPARDPARAAAKAVVVAEVERLHWRIWNGKAKNARKSTNGVRAVMHHFRRERDSRRSIAASRKLWTALQALNQYLTGQSTWLVNHAERHCAGQHVGTSITEKPYLAPSAARPRRMTQLIIAQIALTLSRMPDGVQSMLPLRAKSQTYHFENYLADFFEHYLPRQPPALGEQPPHGKWQDWGR